MELTRLRDGKWETVEYEGLGVYQSSDKDMLREKIEKHVAQREVIHYENGTPILKSQKTPSFEETVDNIMKDIHLTYG